MITYRLGEFREGWSGLGRTHTPDKRWVAGGEGGQGDAGQFVC